MKRVEVKWSQINDFLNGLLVAGGMDLSREMQSHTKWEDNKWTIIYKQDEGAEFTAEEKKRQAEAEVEKSVAKRPAYLENLR